MIRHQTDRVCVRTQQALDTLGTLVWIGAGEETRGEAGGGRGRSGWSSAAAGSAQRATGGGAATSRVLQNRLTAFNLFSLLLLVTGTKTLKGESGLSHTSLVPALVSSFLAGICFAGVAFSLGRLSGWRLTFSTWK